MDRKLKNAIRESFVFPESQHKEEFFRQVGATCAEKRKRRFPVASRLAAAAAALLIGIGIYGASRFRTDFNGGGTEPVTQPVTDTTEDTTAQSTGNTAEVTTAASSSAVSKTTSSGTAKTTAKAQTTALPRTNTTRASVTAAQARTTAPTVTAGVETTTISEYEEGSVTMKKMIAFLSAMGIAATANPTGVYAANEIRLEHIYREMYYYSLWKANQWYYDFNDDGEFDVKDLFEFELYTEHIEECREKYGWYAKDFKNYKELYELYDEEALRNIMMGIALIPSEREDVRKEKVEDISQLVINVDVGGAKNAARYYLYLNDEYPTNDEIREALRDYDFMTADGPDHVDKFIEFIEELRNETIDEAYTEEQLEVFRHLDSDDVEKDLNGDGEVNFYDSYDLLYYIAYEAEVAKGNNDAVDYLPTEVSERIKQYGDIDLNGKIDEDDLLNLFLYLDKIGIRPASYFRYSAEERISRISIPSVMKKYITGENALGDVDNSGAVNAIDASLVLDYYSRASTGQSESFDDAQKKAADADKNGSINAVDASLILSYYVYTSTANGTVEPFETFINS